MSSMIERRASHGPLTIDTQLGLERSDRARKSRFAAVQGVQAASGGRVCDGYSVISDVTICIMFWKLMYWPTPK
jgi:hypothetical protein